MAGVASGYMAALVAQLAARVTATESDPALASKAGGHPCRARLRQCYRPNWGLPPMATQRPRLTTSLSSMVPPRLRRSGCSASLRRVAGWWACLPLTNPSRAMIVTHSHGDFGHRTLFDAAAPVLPGLERHPEFVF